VPRLVLLLAVALSGCVCLPILGGPPPRDDEAAPVANLEDLADLRGIVHCHSKLSHDCSGEFEDVADAAAETSCSFVCFTDHLRHRNEVKDEPSGRIHGVLVLPGAELNCNGGSLLAIGVAAGIDRNLEATKLVAQIRKLGGVAAIGHPEEWHLDNVADVDGCELFNLHAAALAASKAGLVFRFFFFPPRPFFSALIERQDEACAVYDALDSTRPLAAIGACDAHEAALVDTYHRVFRAATTHVLVPSSRTGERLEAQDVLKALAEGRSYAASELTQDATGFRFVARKADGSLAATLGGVAALESGLALEVALPAAGTITLLRDGAPALVVAKATKARFEPTVPGAYRVEATYDGKPWIWSSAIRLTPPPREAGGR